jgi:hypothetical protein
MNSIPAVLMTTSSVLIDATFRRELYRDRIWMQIILWLAVSMSLQETSFGLWIHGIFFCSILSCIYMVLVLRWSFLWSVPDYTRLLAPSLLITLYYDAYLQSEHSSNISWVIFLLIFVSLASWQWYSNQRQQRRQSLVGMPVVTSTVNLSTMNLDECHWNQWTRSQVLQWISNLDDDWRSTVCSLLAPEGITGSVLKGMTTDDLRSMGVSYGDARRLVNHIHQLISTYPDRNQSSGGHQEDILQGWLGDELPQVSTYPDQPVKSFMHETEGFNEETIQKAKDLMKERFGFELPEIRVTNPEEALESNIGGSTRGSQERSDDGEDLGPPIGDTARTTREELSDVAQTASPLDLLSALPEHIREIAIRKPELVKALWTTHQLQSKDRPAPDPERARRLIQEAMPTMSVDTETTIPNDYEDDEETTSLLRKRASNPKYASIR